MNFVSITYTKKQQFDQPRAWLHRIRPYLGVLEELQKYFTVSCIDRIDFSGDIVFHGIHHYFPGFNGPHLSVALKLNRLVKKLKPDIVLVQGMIFPAQVILLRGQVGRKVKIIVQNHAEKPGAGLRGWLQRLSDPFVDAYLFTAKGMGDEWLNRHIIRRAGKIREIMEASSVFNVTDKQHARECTGVLGNPVFLWVGRLDENKDPLTVIRAFLRFTAIQPAARLYMLFQTQELLPAIGELLDREPGGRPSVVLVGEKQHDDMGEWFNSADYIVSGSHYEGSGYAICEAMSCGCIPILTDILSFRTMTGNGNCGILYTPGDEESLLAAFGQVTARDRAIEREKTLRQFRSALSFEVIAAGIYKTAVSP